MVSADRLVAALLVLQARGRVTAAQLAAELEVSEKTARRDLDALARAGVPVYPQVGRNGGWQLLGGARTDLSGLTAGEAQALFLAAGTATARASDVSRALRKLTQALPAPFRAEAEAAAAAVVVDPTAWGGATVPPPPHLDELQRAVIQRRRVVLGYVDRQGNPTERTIDPLGLVAKGQAWYLLADTDAGRRTFRVNRVRSVTVTAEAASRPEGFDLAAAWQDVVDTVGEHRLRVRATVTIGRAYVAGLRGQFGADMLFAELDETVAGDGDRVRVIVGGPAPWIVAQHLAGWGSLVQVEEPDEVRAELRRIGHELAEVYGPA